MEIGKLGKTKRKLSKILAVIYLIITFSVVNTWLYGFVHKTANDCGVSGCVLNEVCEDT